MSELKPQAESLESLLSTAIGLLMSHKERIGYKPNSVIAKFVDECVERLKDWPYTTAAQPAQAVPVLAESELRSILQGTNHMIKNAMHGAFWPELEEACRAVEQAVRAKMGVAVPMTHMQIVMLWGHRSDGPSTPEIVSFARLVERHHGIVGKEGA